MARVVLEDRGVAAEARAPAGGGHRRARPEARVGAQDQERRAEPVGGQRVRRGQRAHACRRRSRARVAAHAGELAERGVARSPSRAAGSSPAPARSAPSAARRAARPRPSASAGRARSRRAAAPRGSAGAAAPRRRRRPSAAARRAAAPGGGGRDRAASAPARPRCRRSPRATSTASSRTRAGHPARVIGVRHGTFSVLAARAPKHARRWRIAGTLRPPEGRREPRCRD